MPQISINSGVKILSYSFSETQQGKSGADRDISKGGRKMRSHRDKQHNVITPEDMFDALNATLQLRATSVFLAELVENSVSSTKIKKMTKLSYFEYHGSDARVWKFHGIGDGEVIKDLKHTNATLDIKKQGRKLATAAVNIVDRKRILASFDKNPGQYEEPTFWLLPHEVAPMLDIEPNARDDDIVTPNRPDPSNPAGAAKQSLFYCRDCGSSFILYRNLLKHIEKGKHFIHPEHVNLLDRVLGLFMRAIEDTLVPEPLSPVSEVVKAFKRASDPELPQGWAIKHGRKVGRYSEATKAFVKAKFDEHAKRGAKLKADEAERLMRADRFIEPKDWMTKSQLRDYINSLKSQLPKMRAWRRQVEHEDMDDEHFEVEVEPSDEDIVITEEDFHRHLTPTMLKKFFSDVAKPVTPNTPVPAGAAEFD
ncbi:hypothetical protein PRIPAC_78438 [Pristionchus pacificus]|uniref:NAD(P)H-hydrate epimerase n=1 Tax=Pristionchus pacificus TaxID=54126 RepID=A0A2A6BYP0_PRIPA|nr:hypothetical protein PRIPAC_78438 [Pristionchus pacificus]|eukprot:PDM71035.1 hypothetical protein PRIPAC_44431 [Pristionchus pacificus]